MRRLACLQMRLIVIVLRIMLRSFLRSGIVVLKRVRLVMPFRTINDVERLARVGEDCLRKEKYDHAIEVFSAIGNKQKLAEVGDKALRERQLGYAAKAYELAGDQQRLSTLGDTCLREGLFATAYKAYTMGGNMMMAQFVKENFGNQFT